MSEFIGDDDKIKNMRSLHRYSYINATQPQARQNDIQLWKTKLKLMSRKNEETVLVTLEIPFEGKKEADLAEEFLSKDIDGLLGVII